MNKIRKDIFKALHEGKWLSIKYRNREENTTNYWIGIRNLIVPTKMLIVDGFHLNQFTVQKLHIYMDSILSSEIVEGSYYPVSEETKRLLEDIRINPYLYQPVFSNIPNLKVLNYLIDCNRLDAVPYRSDYSLIRRLDLDTLKGGKYSLNDRQFTEIVNEFQYKAANGADKILGSAEAGERLRIRQLAMNVLSIPTRRGLYVLAHRKLLLDIQARALTPAKEITICREFTIDGEKQSIRKFLDLDDYCLLEEFENNQEQIKDRIAKSGRPIKGVDDMPYVIAIESRVMVDLNKEYKSIFDRYDEGEEKVPVPVPVAAFFGELLKRPQRRKEYPIALLNNRVNLDQLLAIHNAMKYPLTYVQGPPGTGKTNTIVNTIATALFNGRSVLFTSYNNHPIDSVFETLSNISYRGRLVPFPIVRLGSQVKDREALKYMKDIYERTRQMKIFSNTLEKNRGDKIERTKKLTELLKRHEEFLDLTERAETLEKLIDSNRRLTFTVQLQGKQLADVRVQQNTIGRVTDAQALELLVDDMEEFIKYLNFMSAAFIKKLDEPIHQELLRIIHMSEPELQLSDFERYLKNGDNVTKFLKIFPIVATTCISAHKLGEPKPYFDMVIMDEASQCNTAMGLVPVLRGNSLMLVGDPQQLNPVILLDQKDNQVLRRNYSVSKEYDYISNSLYKCYLAVDSVSDEILLSYHYRCHENIINFNNRKYYNNMLHIMTQNKTKDPLVFVDIENNRADSKNTAPMEAQVILNYALQHRGKKLGVITPFVNQREYLENLLRENGIEDVACGTVHAFQGDEKDVIFFSLALTNQTHESTYQWLKNNKELINVATSRAKNQLIILGDSKNLKRLHEPDSEDDLFELMEYVRTKGVSKVTPKRVASRALGVKPYSSETEAAFLVNLNHAMDNILYEGRRCVIHKEVGISHVFRDALVNPDLFYSGRFDFVVYELAAGKEEIPILAIELDGKEHEENEVVMLRDRKKEEICRQHGFELIRIENSYARRYHHVKEILIRYFERLYRV